MSVNLILSGCDRLITNSEAWEQICVLSQEGLVFINDETVDTLGIILDGVMLKNGEFVTAYGYEDEDYATFISSFGPSILPEDINIKVKEILKEFPKALVIYEEMERLSLQVSFSGKESCEAYIKAVNWIADEITINRTYGNMFNMIKELGLKGSCWSFEEFKNAVILNGLNSDYCILLENFIKCGIRNNAKKVYYG